MRIINNLGQTKINKTCYVRTETITSTPFKSNADMLKNMYNQINSVPPRATDSAIGAIGNTVGVTGTIAGTIGNTIEATGKNMILNENSIEELISELNAIKSEIQTLRDKVDNNIVKPINNVWISDEVDAYIDKLALSNIRSAKVIDGIDLLIKTYKNVIESATTTKQEVSSIITNN